MNVIKRKKRKVKLSSSGRRGRYNSRILTHDESGEKFKSETELKRWLVLRERERNGVIRNLQRASKDCGRFELCPAFTDKHTGEKYRAVYYTADFVYEQFDDGEQLWRQVVEDCKSGSYRTPEFKRTRKFFRYMYPDVHFFENGKQNGTYQFPSIGGDE